MIDSKLLISIIINCFNGEKFLRETIDSVVNQTYTNWEIIFWDNQSTDSTAEIVQSYKDNRIRYFYAPNHTPLGEARNLAMKEARGDYIGFWMQMMSGLILFWKLMQIMQTRILLHL